MANLKFEILDQEKFIKENNLKEVKNPVLFSGRNQPTADGLLSNEIFGITQEERSGIYAYIDLKENFIQPYFFKIWLKIDRNLRACVYETQNFIIDNNGYLVPDDNGNTGLKWLYANRNKLNFKNTKKDTILNALIDARKKDKLFTSKLIVIPPYYRDVDTSKGGKVGVGEINKLYISLLNSVKALSESQMFGFEMIGGTRGRIQDILTQIYNWFTVGESVIGGEHTGSGLFKKFGLLRRSVMSKTTDNSARLVISAPNINANSIKELMVDMDYSAAPLSAALVVAYPFVIHELHNFFMNEFGGKTRYPVLYRGKLTTVELANPLLEFSDDRFDAEMNEFIHGYSNRFKPVQVPNTEGLDVRLRFKGYSITAEQYTNGMRENGKMIERDLTWVDIFYMVAVAATEDKVAIITRYPVDSYFNQLYTRIHVSSTIKTEPMVINGKFYPWYPHIEQKDIGSNTSNKFIDTLSMANPYCVLMGADYDGDQITLKMAYSIESNEELKRYMESKAQFITLSGSNGRVGDKEAIQAMYSMTLVLPDAKNKLTQKINMA